MAEDIDVGMKCIKYMLFVANFMFVMIGFLLISIGSTIKAIYGDFEAFMSSHYFSPATLAIAIGVIIFFVALFGCVGAIKESTCLINTFAFFMTLVLILEVAAAISSYALRAQLSAAIREKMEITMDQYIDGHNKYIHSSWDFLQQRLYCCGIDDSDDWHKYPHHKLPSSPEPTEIKNITFWIGPESCCRHIDVDFTTCEEEDVFQSGCLDALTYIVSESALLLGCGALAVAFIQMLGIIFAYMLAKAVRRLKTEALVERQNIRQEFYEQMSQNKTEPPTPVLYTPTYSEA